MITSIGMMKFFSGDNSPAIPKTNAFWKIWWYAVLRFGAVWGGFTAVFTMMATCPC